MTMMMRTVGMYQPLNMKGFYFACADRALGVVGHCYSGPVEEFSCRELCKRPGKLQNGSNKQPTNNSKPKPLNMKGKRLCPRTERSFLQELESVMQI